MLIDGRFVLAASGKTFPVYNPATGEVVAQVPEAEAEDVDRAVSRCTARLRRGPWSRMSPSQRGQLIWKMADLLEANLEEFAEIESLDNGKPFSVARVADLPLAIDMFRYMAGWATKISGSTLTSPPPAPSTPTPCANPSAWWADHSLEFPAPDGGVEACAGPGRRLLRRA